jgi:hypothetical protein
MATTSVPSAGAEERRGRVLTAIRRIKPPKTLVVTVLGALFTLWLLPAFTRQWEDRQKARELQASLVEEIAVASSEAEAAAEAGASGLDADSEAVAAGTAGAIVTDAHVAWEKWQVEQNKVDARLRAYFDANVVDEWARYANAQSSVLAIARIDSDYATKPLPTFAASVIQAHIDELLKAPGIEVWTLRRMDDFAGPDPSLRELAITYAQDDLANSRAIVTDSILAESPRGFSTSRRDLVSDLLP